MNQTITRIGLLAVWLGAAATAAWLYLDVGEHGPVLGFAEAVEMRLGALAPARVVHVAVEVGQEVEAGQVVAILDSSDLEAQIRILEAEQAQVEAERGAVEAEARETTSSSVARLELAVEQAESALVEAEAEHRTAAAELSAVATRRRQLRTLVEQQMADAKEVAEIEVRHATLEKDVSARARTVAALKARVATVKARRDGHPSDTAEAVKAPLDRQVSVIAEQVAQLRAQRDALTLRAPAAGRVSAVLAQPGDVVEEGIPIVTLVRSHGGRVVACLAEDRALTVSVGDPVELWPHGAYAGTVRGRTVAIAPSVVELPLRCWRDPNRPSFGRSVVIALDSQTDLVPGQAFDVRITPRRRDAGAGGTAIAAPAADESTPGLLAVPAKLMAETRFEPSGLLWVPDLGRYVVVSDDTGIQATASEHMPALFGVDARGRVDEQLLRVTDLGKTSDLESIAPGPDGSLYVLASQSFSKKGKRSKARQVFAWLVRAGDGFRAQKVVRLASLIDALTPEARRALGLAGVPGDTAALNIEGMCATRDGLLLGLKAPVDENGRALIWRLPHPSRLFAGDSLADAGLALLTRVPLTVHADGKDVPGGIAELLELPDGRLLFGVTASGLRPKHQDGSLWVTGGTAREPVLDVRRVQTFTGLKPEGLALAPEPGKFVVVFDADQGRPLWTELEWPRS